jgi:hypothetical protein
MTRGGTPIQLNARTMSSLATLFTNRKLIMGGLVVRLLHTRHRKRSMIDIVNTIGMSVSSMYQ